MQPPFAHEVRESEHVWSTFHKDAELDNVRSIVADIRNRPCYLQPGSSVPYFPSSLRVNESRKSTRYEGYIFLAENLWERTTRNNENQQRAEPSRISFCTLLKATRKSRHCPTPHNEGEDRTVSSLSLFSNLLFDSKTIIFSLAGEPLTCHHGAGSPGREAQMEPRSPLFPFAGPVFSSNCEEASAGLPRARSGLTDGPVITRMVHALK